MRKVPSAREVPPNTAAELSKKFRTWTVAAAIGTPARSVTMPLMRPGGVLDRVKLILAWLPAVTSTSVPALTSCWPS